MDVQVFNEKDLGVRVHFEVENRKDQVKIVSTSVNKGKDGFETY